MKASLWLYPPPLSGLRLRSKIEHLSERYSGSKPFEPHITLLGGINIDSEEHDVTLCYHLQQHLKGRYGDGILCQFEYELRSMTNGQGKIVWNQAFVSVLKRNEGFDRLVDDIHSFLGRKVMYPPPLGEPHLSLYYGNHQVPPMESVGRPDDFLSTTLALWFCSPPSVEGVQEWREIGSRIELT